MTQTNPKKRTGGDAIAWFKSEWIYDEIMGQIEPDLLTKNIDRLDEKYRNETAEQRGLRFEHYDFAFFIFHQSLSTLNQQMNEELITLSEEMQQKVQSKQAAEEEERLSQLEEELDLPDMAA